MKTTLYFTLTLLTFVSLVFVLNSSAQEVKTYLLIPNDRTAPDDIDATLDSMIKDAQSMFMELMDKQGFGSKTFAFEADSTGNAVVQHVTGQHNDAWYHDKYLSHVTDELNLSSDSKSLVIIDVSGGSLYNVAQATGDVALLPASGSYFEADIIAHELAHTFGLLHHAIKDDTLISNSYTPDLMLSSYCFAEWLDVHPYFNPGQTSSSGSTTIQMLTPVASPPDTVLFSFQITDSDGLHQAQLTTGYDVIACKTLSSENATIEFAINDQLGLITSNGSFSLYVIDVYGSYSSQTFTTDISTLLSPTNISFPDDNLAAAIREHLGITSGNLISSQDMQRLENFYPTNHQISDLTGIEYAVNTHCMGFINNNIQDITPLAGLSQLTNISLDDNQISDLTPLAGLINLHFLDLAKNQISDLAPLADLTRLETLILSDNQITDVKPLSNLESLTDLQLRGNRIQNRTPLQALQNQNPDLIIDIDPVTVVNRSPEFTEGSNATRSVFEETVANVNIGSPITATDADNDTLTYTLSGVDAASFTINQLTGQLTTKVGVELDYETKSTYTITVTVSDTQGNTDIINVTINIQDVNETAVNNPPIFGDSNGTSRSIEENTSAGEAVGSPITATDPDSGDTLTYSISGTDATSFDIDSNTGQLKTKATLDYDMKNEYTVVVSVSDGNGSSASITVTINVTQEGENQPSEKETEDPTIETEVDETTPISGSSTQGQVSFSELMFTSRGGLHSLAQWMELYNNSKTNAVNLKGWQLTIEARDANGKHRHVVVTLEDLSIPPDQTVLMVTWNAGRKSDGFTENRIYNFFSHHFNDFEQNQHRNMVLGQIGFSLKLTDPDGIVIDVIGNLDGDPATSDEPLWEIPSGTTENGARASILRRYDMDTRTPLDGTALDNWVSTSNFPLLITRYWGSITDIGNPGYRGNSAVPVTLSHFTAELTNIGVILKWITESEVDNAGFYIYRRETKEGEFKVVNPTMIQGAGTTGERNEYTWTDATAKPNTVYYYRIEDVSHAGERVQLATVRLRGFVSASGKLTIRWADLKI